MFWNESRQRRIAIALLISFFSAWLIYILSPGNTHSSLWTGDFPGFYGPAAMVLDGHSNRLYDYPLQQEYQNKAWPSFKGSFYIFAYPPYVAAMLSPWALFPPVIAKLLSTVFLLICALAATWLLLRFFELPRDTFHYTLAICLAPIFISIVGSQNTAIGLLLLALMAHCHKTERYFLSGLSAALMFYKPQYGLFAAVLLLSWRQRQALLGFCAGLLFYYLLGLILMGPLWPLHWIEDVSKFGNLNYSMNAYQMVSLNGLGYASLNVLGFEETVLNSAIGFLTLLSLLLAALWAIWTILRPYECSKQALADLAILTPILAPQTLFYDLGLALPALMFFEFRSRTSSHDRALSLIALFWMLLYLALVARTFSQGPAFLLPVLMLFIVLRPHLGLRVGSGVGH